MRHKQSIAQLATVTLDRVELDSAPTNDHRLTLNEGHLEALRAKAKDEDHFHDLVIVALKALRDGSWDGNDLADIRKGIDATRRGTDFATFSAVCASTSSP